MYIFCSVLGCVPLSNVLDKRHKLVGIPQPVTVDAEELLRQLPNAFWKLFLIKSLLVGIYFLNI
jgi:hypothetical protein